jgi:hypothetical protein
MDCSSKTTGYREQEGNVTRVGANVRRDQGAGGPRQSRRTGVRLGRGDQFNQPTDKTYAETRGKGAPDKAGQQGSGWVEGTNFTNQRTRLTQRPGGRGLRRALSAENSCMQTLCSLTRARFLRGEFLHADPLLSNSCAVSPRRILACRPSAL